MQKKTRLIEQNDSIQKSTQQALRVKNGGSIDGTEGGLRLDVFDHYGFSTKVEAGGNYNSLERI